MSKFLVVVTRGSDSAFESDVYQFNDYDKASAFIRWAWNKHYKELTWDHISLNRDECWCDEEQAKITWDDGSFMLYTMAFFCQAPETFNVHYHRLMAGDQARY